MTIYQSEEENKDWRDTARLYPFKEAFWKARLE